MKILLLNQAFYPDVVSTGQHATDLALKLSESGHEVTAITSRRAYDSPAHRFAKTEKWRGINIRRIRSFGWGKTAKWRRALDFGSFLANCFLHLLRIGRQDVVVAFTSPPLISFLGALAVRLRGGSMVFWVMDLNPDQAVEAGWLQADSRTTGLLRSLLNFSLNSSETVVTLDRFMANRVLEKGIDASKVTVIPPWSHDHAVCYDPAGREAFRRRHGISGKFVVMYSGNHSPCHPLDTLLQSALALRAQPGIVFCFVGGGSEFIKVLSFTKQHGLENIVCLPYQPLNELSASLSAADLHAVVMGDRFVGVVHPCKVYNILALGVPFLYIGPEESHVTELNPDGSFRHGEASRTAAFILQQSRETADVDPRPDNDFSCSVLVSRMADVIERAGLRGRRRWAASTSMARTSSLK